MPLETHLLFLVCLFEKSYRWLDLQFIQLICQNLD